MVQTTGDTLLGGGLGTTAAKLRPLEIPQRKPMFRMNCEDGSKWKQSKSLGVPLEWPKSKIQHRRPQKPFSNQSIAVGSENLLMLCD